MRELCGNVIEAAQNSAMHVAIFVVRRPADDAAGEAALERTRHELVRLIGLAVALVLQACHRVRDLDWLAENELLERGSAYAPRVLSEDPGIVVFDHFLSDEEAERLIALSERADGEPGRLLRITGAAMATSGQTELLAQK